MNMNLQGMWLLLLTFAIAAAERSMQDSSSVNIPEQIHISLASPASTALGTHAITVSWVTFDDADSGLWYGLGEELESFSSGKSSRYTFEQNYTSPYLHQATMTNLLPGEMYWYYCGDKNQGVSEIRDVRLPPAVGDGSSPYLLGIVGDIGQTNDSAITFGHIQEYPLPIVMLHAGDLAYADCEQDRWDTYGRLAEEAASRIPWMTVPGNHEIEIEPDTGNAFVAYEARYTMPAVKPALFNGNVGSSVSYYTKNKPVFDMQVKLESSIARSQNELDAEIQIGSIDSDIYRCTPSEWLGSYDYGNSFYSFDVATTHVVGLNPYTSTEPDSEQYRWLAADLAAIDRSKTPWLIVMTHCPWYNTNFAHQLEYQTIAMKESMESLFTKFKVALVISGHVHAYERTYPVSNWRLADLGPTYIVIGDGGNREGHAQGYFVPPEWSAARDDNTFGHGRLTVNNETHAYWEWRRNVDGEPEVGDQAWIVNPWNS